MALLKLICNTGAKLFVDQEFVSELQENKLCITELSAGMYLVDVVSLIDDQIKVSFELSFGNDNQQILKRIDLAEEEKEYKQNELKSELMRNPNLSFYRNLARFEYNGLWGYVDNNYEIVVEPIYSSAENFFNEFALVSKSFSEEIKYALIDTKGKNRMGVWFDELIFRNEKRLFVRRNNDLLSYDVLEGKLFTYNLSGEIKDDDLIPVLWENNYSKKGGYINLRGEVVLPFIYDQVSNFNDNGFAEVERFDIRRFINKSGKVCVLNTIEEIDRNDKNMCFLDDRFDWCGRLETSDSDSLFLYGIYRLAVMINGKWGYYYIGQNQDKQNQLYEVFPCEYDEVLSNSEYGYVVMKKGTESYVINLVGAKYKKGDKAGQDVIGAFCQIMFKYEADNIYPIINKRYEFVDEIYNPKCQAEIYFYDSFVIKKNHKYGIVDKWGNTILPCEYDDIYYPKGEKVKTHEFLHNYIVTEKSGIYELRNKKGEPIISNLLNIYNLKDYLSSWVVKKKSDPDCWYLFHHELYENTLLDIPFDEIHVGYWYYDYGEHVLREYIIKYKGKYGVIDKNGKLILNCEYDRIEIENDGFERTNYIIVKNNKYGYCDSKGTIIVDCLYDSVSPQCAYEGYIESQDSYIEVILIVVQREGKFGLIDYNGQVLADTIYDEIDFKNSEYDELSQELTYRVRQGMSFFEIRSELFLDR